jgi:hypothetical protein
MLLYLCLVLSTVRKTGSPRRDLLGENLALRQQLAVDRRQTHRPRRRQTDRLFWTLLARGWWGWRDALIFVRPETVIRWDRARWRRYWSWRSRGRSPGRPRISREAQALIRQLVQENPRWGAPRPVEELQALGHDVSIRTVRRYRFTARRRPPSQRWRTFLRNHSPQHLGDGSLHRADCDLPDPLRPRRNQPRPPADRTLERHASSARRVDLAAGSGSHGLGAPATILDPRPRPLFRDGLRGASRGDRNRHHSDARPSAECKRHRRTRHRDLTPGVPGPSHRDQ